MAFPTNSTNFGTNVFTIKTTASFESLIYGTHLYAIGCDKLIIKPDTDVQIWKGSNYMGRKTVATTEKPQDIVVV